MAIKPLGDRIVIRPLEKEEEQIGGIIIPAKRVITARLKPRVFLISLFSKT